MKKAFIIALTILSLSASALPQSQSESQPIRISAELVQLDVVAIDKEGRLITNLTRDDFTIFERGKRQQIYFFEFVQASARPQRLRADKQVELPRQELLEADLRRVFAFVIDDLTIDPDDLTFIRQMLAQFVEKQMREGDLVMIARTVGGKGLLQQFTTSKEMLRRAINSLTPRTHPLSQSDPTPVFTTSSARLDADIAGEPLDMDSTIEDVKESMRAYMSLSTANFVIDGMRELPGRKSLVLVSGGLPVLSTRPRAVIGDALYFLNQLTDKATRAGVAVHTLDVRGLSSGLPRTSVAQNVEIGPTVLLGTSPGPGLPTGGDTVRGGPDMGIYSRAGNIFFSSGRLNSPSLFNIVNAQQGLRLLSYATGGIPILNKNDFSDGLNRIAIASDGYYLLAYTPSDAKFDSRFRSVEIKVNRPGAKVYYRRGYFAREESAATSPATKQEQILAAVKSPLARRDIELDAMLLYKAQPPAQGAIDIHMIIDPKKLQFDPVDGKHETSFDVAGFVFDEFGKLRGGFNDTINARLTDEERARASREGLSYSANTRLPAGAYQVRLAVRDSKSGQIGTLSRYLEVPDLSKGRLTASSLLLGAVAAGDMKAESPTPITASRQIAGSQDLRYAVMIYNAKQKDGLPQVKTQLKVLQRGKVIFEETEEPAQQTASGQLIKWGQLGLKNVKPGRYTLMLVVTDALADKKSQTVTRSNDFVVTN